MPETRHDVLIVGSGAAGAFAARELTAQGLSVLMLEAGPPVGPRHFRAAKPKPKTAINLTERGLATLAGQHLQARALFFSRKMGRFFVNDRRNPYTTPKGEPFLWVRGRQEGGRMHSFGRVLMRWTDDDFRLRSRAGRGLDWAFDYAEIAPYYEEVEQMLGLYGNEDGAATMPDSLYAHPAYLTEAERLFRDRVEAEDPAMRVVSWRYVAAAPDRMLAPMREAKASGLLEIRHDAVVRRVLTDKAGRAAGVEFTDRIGRDAHVARAAAVVLCASPVETVRLMLNSASDSHPDGLGNSSGKLGRYFMDQLPVLAQGQFPAARGWEEDRSPPADPFYAKPGGIFIARADRPVTERGEYAFQGSLGRAAVPDRNDPAAFSFFGFGQMLPHEDNRITLDPARLDAWGIPVPHIRCVMHDYEKTLIQRQQEELMEIVCRAGGEFDFIGSPLGLTEMNRGGFPHADPVSRLFFRKMFTRSMCMGSAIHETGGAVMGTDPAASVVNTWGQSWDVPNLVVADASTFAGSGVSGTTLTVMAQAVRACRHLAGELAAGRL
ncbi:GMC oxidoreductase [Poseidonocella sp. HB161398]|uniref:GMC oxidoreductase n=1 Tax=Poseidonocella sp. HB161398 TaxID=2320855 RepID=UPI001108D16A|nr:GMC family oxidoreductase [Poseidonocella sp. HB161398]